MDSPKTLDLSHLPHYAISNQAPLWWGQLMVACIEGSMFLVLIGAFLYTRLRVDVWPLPGEHFPNLLLPTLALVPLLASAYGSYLASEAAKKDDRRGMIVGMLVNLVLASIFFYLRLVEWHSLNFNWKADINGSYVWAFLSLHSFDVVGDLVFTLVLLVSVAIGRYGEKQRLGVHVDSVVWYFLVAIWIPIYVVLYLGPRLMES
jgi:cytochrome c oxidase subunit 3